MTGPVAARQGQRAGFHRQGQESPRLAPAVAHAVFRLAPATAATVMRAAQAMLGEVSLALPTVERHLRANPEIYHCDGEGLWTWAGDHVPPNPAAARSVAERRNHG